MMNTMYQIPVLSELNWKNYTGKLHEYPVRVSCFNSLESYIHVKDVGFKYVFDGNEHYAFNRKGYSLSGGQYVIGNKHHPCEVNINNGRQDWGICVDLNSDQIKQSLYSIQHPDAIDDEEICKPFFFSEELFQQASSSGVGLRSHLNQIMNAARKEEGLLNLQDTMLHITAAILADQKPLMKAYSRLHAVKSQTKKEQFNRLQKAISILRDSLCQEICMAEVAREAMLSEFRLFHLFKSAFGVTPYQFLLKERMEYAIVLRSTSSYTWSEIATMVGFAEPTSFTKAFKKIKGVSPINYPTIKN